MLITITSLQCLMENLPAQPREPLVVTEVQEQAILFIHSTAVPPNRLPRIVRLKFSRHS